MLKSEGITIEQRHALLSQRERLIERLILARDKAGLIQILEGDRENIASLQIELKQMRESISNINKVQQYACCTE